MRLYYSIIIGFIVICCLSFTTKYYASTWGGTASNQTVSVSALADAVTTGVFIQKTSFSGTTKQITKSEAIAWVYLNEAKASLAAKASNQLVVKSDLESGDPLTATLTITYEGNKWYAELSTAIASTDIYVGAGVARGYYDACLGAPDETVDMWIDAGKIVTNGFFLFKGNTINSGYTPFEQFSGSVINYNMINNVVINGVTRFDGDTFTVGGTTVTLSLPLSCTPYS